MTVEHSAEKGKSRSPQSGSEGAPHAINGKEGSLWLRITLTLAILAAGVLGMAGLSNLKKAPAEATAAEPVLPVEVLAAVPEDVPVIVSGLGEARALNVVPVSPEIPGVVVEIHPRLEVGERISAGELLFRIDQRNYQAARDQALAQVAQTEKTIERLERQYRIDQDRLATLERNQNLMAQEFERVKALYEEDEVGTQSGVNQAEMTLNQTADARDQLAQAIALYPVQIQEARSGLEAARAQLALAGVNLERTEFRADFDARVKTVALEAGQYVTPGAPVLTLADDRILEISVSLDSRDVRDWLIFDPDNSETPGAWFGSLKSVTCAVRWTESPSSQHWEGVVHRVESFDPATRTVNVAVRVSREAARGGEGGLPLVEGMFCRVDIPGRTMHQVYRLPRWAVSFEGNVFVSRDNRLAILPVEVIRSQGEETFVRGGLEPGTEVITTRLVNPLPNHLLAVDRNPDAAS